jgi:uncharacterized protein involved in exopolysaccharide biosynthesis
MNQKTTIPHEDEIDLKALFLTIWKHKKIIILITTLITVLSFFYVLNKKNVYQVDTLIEIGVLKKNNNSDNSDKYIVNPEKTKFC